MRDENRSATTSIPSLIFMFLAVTCAAQNSFNVVDFGADPRGVSNSTTAVNNACSAAATAGGGIIYFPNGKFVIDGASICGSNLTFKGARIGVTTLFGNISGGSACYNGTSNIGSCIANGIANAAGNHQLLSYSDVTFEDLTFTGTMNLPPGCTAAYTCTKGTNQPAKTSTGTEAQWGIYISGSLDTADGSYNIVKNVTVRRCAFRNIAQAPFHQPRALTSDLSDDEVSRENYHCDRHELRHVESGR